MLDVEVRDHMATRFRGKQLLPALLLSMAALVVVYVPVAGRTLTEMIAPAETKSVPPVPVAVPAPSPPPTAEKPAAPPTAEKPVAPIAEKPAAPTVEEPAPSIAPPPPAPTRMAVRKAAKKAGTHHVTHRKKTGRAPGVEREGSIDPFQ